MRAERFRCYGRDCPVRGDGTRDPKGRQVEVWPHTPVVLAMRGRLSLAPAQASLSQRQEIFKPRFGQIKQHEGFWRWTVWGLEGVRTPWAVLCATLNLSVLYQRWRANRPESRTTRVGRIKKVARHAGQIVFSVEAWPDLVRARPALGLFPRRALVHPWWV